MSLRAECSCGKVFRAKEESAGKKVKCPGCGKGVAIAKGGTEASPSPGVDSSAKGKLCSCGAMLKADAVLCVKCGFDWRTGSKHQQGRVKKARKEKGVVDKALDASAPGLTLVWGALLFVCVLIAILGMYGIWTTRVGRAIDAAADIRFFRDSFPGGAAVAWICALGGWAGGAVFGWLLKKSLTRFGKSSYNSLIKELKRKAASATDPAERAELEKMLMDAQAEKDDMMRDLR